MSSATLIFPHQLLKNHPALKKGVPVFLIEEWLFFNQYNFHQQKIVLHRASMKAYEAYLLSQKFSVIYIDSFSPLADVQKLLHQFKKEGVTEIHFANVVDNWLQKRIVKSSKKQKITIVEYDTPNFLNTTKSVASFFDEKKKYFQTDFYIEQRKQRNILIDGNKKPIGGKWTFDAENREKFPKTEVAPSFPKHNENNFVAEAKKYTQKHFAKNYGSVDSFIYPIDFLGAEKWLDNFLKNRFAKFGIYEDAIVANENYLYHSVLTPMLNIGLLNPQQIIDKALAFAQKNEVPLNSVEGFIRQIMGWREFIKIVYEREGSKQRTTNYWSFTRKIPASFWNGTTGIAPIDNVVKKALKTGYSHHIERLMVLGNFMLLCEFDPNEVYKWFMEMYVDAYDWVMVPNVYGMTQFADGGLMTTKPYISGSNYLFKMSDYKKEESWSAIWDGLFWRFMHVHRSFFTTNPRLGMLVNTFDKMNEEKRKAHLNIAEKYLQQLDNETKKEK
jgi:deoxyribodipyrimidine photolyase-related protein